MKSASITLKAWADPETDKDLYELYSPIMLLFMAVPHSNTDIDVVTIDDIENLLKFNVGKQIKVTFEVQK